MLIANQKVDDEGCICRLVDYCYLTRNPARSLERVFKSKS